MGSAGNTFDSEPACPALLRKPRRLKSSFADLCDCLAFFAVNRLFPKNLTAKIAKNPPRSAKRLRLLIC